MSRRPTEPMDDNGRRQASCRERPTRRRRGACRAKSAGKAHRAAGATGSKKACAVMTGWRSPEPIAGLDNSETEDALQRAVSRSQYQARQPQGLT